MINDNKLIFHCKFCRRELTDEAGNLICGCDASNLWKKQHGEYRVICSFEGGDIFEDIGCSSFFKEPHE